MLFRKDIPHTCALCQFSRSIDTAEFLCSRYGVVGANYKCRRFKYDPTKRIPSPKLKVSSDLDFKIEG